MTTATSTTGTRIVGALYRKRAALAVLLCLNVVYFFAYFQRVAVPGTVFDEIQTTFAISATAVASLGAVYLYIYGGMQLFVGMMTDRFGPFRVLLVGGVLLSIGAIAFPLGNSLPELYLARALVGLGASLVFLCVVKGVDVLFAPVHFPLVLAISQAIGSSGGLAGTLPFERAVFAWGWREALLGAGIFTALAVLLSFIVFARAGSLAAHRVAATPVAIAGILRNRYSWPMLIAGPLNFGIYFLVQATIGKKFLTDYCQLSSAKAASFTFFMMLATMLIGIVGAMLTRVIGDRRKPLIVASIAATGTGVAMLLLALHFQLSSGWFLFGYLLMGGSSIGSSLGNALMKELNPPEAVATAIGALNSMCYIIVAALTTVAGAVMDRHWTGGLSANGAKIYPPEAYWTIFLICFGIAVFAFLVSLTLRETHGRPLFPRNEQPIA